MPNLSESSGDVARQIIDACNYLNSNEIWNRDSMNARPYIVGLWDDLNRRNSKNIIDIWTPRLVEVGVHRWPEILEACRKILVKNYDNIFMLGENLDMDVYIELAYCDKRFCREGEAKYTKNRKNSNTTLIDLKFHVYIV